MTASGKIEVLQLQEVRRSQIEKSTEILVFLSSAVEAHQLLEAGLITGKIVLQCD